MHVMDSDGSEASDNDFETPFEDVFEPLNCVIEESDWTATVPRTRTKKRDILHEKEGLTETSRHVKTFREAFDLFMTSEIKEVIVRFSDACRHCVWGQTEAKR